MVAAALTVVSVGVPSAALALARTPSDDPQGAIVIAQDLWGYAVARHPTASSYQPGPTSSRDDMGTTVTIVHAATGIYDVRFPNNFPVTPNWGTVLVAALSTHGAFCSVGDFGSQLNSYEGVIATCFDRTGAAADTKFAVDFLDLHTLAGRSAYVFANQPSASSYTPDLTYQFNSTGGTNTIDRLSAGRYAVRLPGLGSSHGNVQVSSMGTGFCRVISWGPDSGDQLVQVQCQDASGDPVDSTFLFVFTQDQGLKQHGAHGVAYLEANRPTAGSYTPEAHYRYSSAGKASHVARTGVGSYVVTVPGLPAGGSAQVTAYGAGTSRCNLASIATSGSLAKIGVICLKPNGHPVDSRFGLSFVH